VIRLHDAGVHGARGFGARDQLTHRWESRASARRRR
jgi:hypothetical protein